MNFERLKNYIMEDEFEIKIVKNRINVINYVSIGQFDSNKVIINGPENIVIINGNDLVVSKLLKDEILITGNIKNLELR